MSPTDDPIGEQVSQLRDALASVPAVDDVVIYDFEGQELRLSCVLPARQQTRVFAALGTLFAGRALAEPALGEANLLQLLVEVLTDDAALERVGAAFRAAYPRAAGEGDPLDVFPMEELVTALVPPLVRPLKRAAALLTEASASASATSKGEAATSVTIRDVTGQEHRLKCALPARRQVEAFRALARLMQTGVAALAQPTRGGLGALVTALVADGQLVEELAQAFRVAYPTLAKTHEPLDSFALEEIVAALAPLVLRILRRGGAALAQLA